MDVDFIKPGDGVWENAAGAKARSLATKSNPLKGTVSSDLDVDYKAPLWFVIRPMSRPLGIDFPRRGRFEGTRNFNFKAPGGQF